MKTAVPSSNIVYASNMNDKYNLFKLKVKYYDQVNHVLTTIQACVNQARQLFGLIKSKLNGGVTRASKIARVHLLQVANEMDDIVDKHDIGTDIIPPTTKNQK